VSQQNGAHALCKHRMVQCYIFILTIQSTLTDCAGRQYTGGVRRGVRRQKCERGFELVVVVVGVISCGIDRKSLVN